MKKSLMILLVCTLLTIISACANNNPGLVPSVPQYDYEYTTLEQLSENADNVIIGTVDSVEQADDLHSFFHIKDLKVLCGQDVDSVSIYGVVGLMEEGGRYCLFTYNNDKVFWPMPLTLLVDRESIFEIQSGKVIAPDRFGMTGMSEDELIDAATNRADRYRRIAVRQADSRKRSHIHRHGQGVVLFFAIFGRQCRCHGKQGIQRDRRKKPHGARGRKRNKNACAARLAGR